VKSNVKSEKKKRKMRKVKNVQHHKTSSWYQPGSLGMTGIVAFVLQ